MGFLHFYSAFATLLTCSTSVVVYPNSLSYQEYTVARSPSTTFVKPRSTTAPYGSPIISVETTWSSVTFTDFDQRGSSAARRNTSFISAAVVFWERSAVIITQDPVMTGTRIAIPSKIPSSSGMTLMTDSAAPVEEGTMFTAAARPP